jgi:hypothetical protein
MKRLRHSPSADGQPPRIGESCWSGLHTASLVACGISPEVLDTLNYMGIEFVSFRENLDTGGPLGGAVVMIVSRLPNWSET